MTILIWGATPYRGTFLDYCTSFQSSFPQSLSGNPGLMNYFSFMGLRPIPRYLSSYPKKKGTKEEAAPRKFRAAGSVGSAKIFKLAPSGLKHENLTALRGLAPLIAPPSLTRLNFRRGPASESKEIFSEKGERTNFDLLKGKSSLCFFLLQEKEAGVRGWSPV